MTRFVVFDVNETLLDLSALDDSFVEWFGDPEARKEWFSQLLQLALVVTLTGTYRDFATLAGEALQVVAAKRGVDPSDAAVASILEAVGSLPPHPDVPAALRRLSEAGLRLAALTNSPLRTVRAQLEGVGLIDLFDKVLSVEPTRRFKPAAEPYLMACRELGIEPPGMWMVAAHDWDVLGAKRVGCAGAFVARPGQGYAAGIDPPDVVGDDLAEVADRLLAIELG